MGRQISFSVTLTGRLPVYNVQQFVVLTKINNVNLWFVLHTSRDMLISYLFISAK